MTYLIVAYALIAVVLIGYGFSLGRRLQAARSEIASLDLTMREEQSPVGTSGR